MKTLLSKLQFETFLFDLDTYVKPPVISGYKSAFEDDQTLAVEIERNQGVNDLFEQFTKQGIKVLSMRNKSNRVRGTLFEINRRKHEAGEKNV